MDHETSGDRPGFFRRFGVAFLVLGLMAAGLAALAALLRKERPVKRAAEAPVVRITAPTPPPPPPPKPPEPKPDEPKPEPEAAPDKLVEPEPAPAEEAKAADPAPADAAMGTSIQGNGDDGFGLAFNRTGGGNTIGGGGSGRSGGGGGEARDVWAGYARAMQPRLLTALAANKTTRAATLSVKLRLWADATGRITRVELPESTGDAAIDAALRTEVFAGLALDQAPPAGMPMPILLRLSGRRP